MQFHSLAPKIGCSPTRFNKLSTDFGNIVKDLSDAHLTPRIFSDQNENVRVASERDRMSSDLIFRKDQRMRSIEWKELLNRAKEQFVVTVGDVDSATVLIHAESDVSAEDVREFIDSLRELCGV